MKSVFNLLRRRSSALAASTLCLAITAFPLSLHADDLAANSSLKLAPIDADIYQSSFHLREQYDRLMNGPVIAALRKVDAIDQAIEQFRADWKEREGNAAQVRVVMENPNFQAAMAFFTDIASQEVFFIGDKNISGLYNVSARFNEDLNKLIQKNVGPEEANEFIGKWATELLGKTTMPMFVIGGKFTDEELAMTKLDEIEGVLSLGLGVIPDAQPFLKTLKRVEDKRGSRLQWTFSGKQIPWDSLPTTENFDEETRDVVRDLAEKKTITLTLGMLDNYFIFAISPDAESITSLGTGSKSLIDHEDLKPVRDLSAKSIIGVAYSSDVLAKANFNASLKGFFSKNLNTNQSGVFDQLEENSELRDYLKNLVDDMKWLDDSIGALVPEFKGSTSVTFLTDSGWERHDHFRTKDVVFNSSAKIEALQHVGGNPLFMTAMNTQQHPEYFKLIRDIATRAKKHIEELSTLNLTDDEKEMINQDALKKFLTAWPMLVRVADIWEQKFAPAMNGEHAIVLSEGSLTSNKWFKEMPESDTPLPLPEFASITGVKNSELMKSGFNDLFALCDDIVEIARKENPDAIPEGYKIPRPVKSKNSSGEKFGYPIPDDCPVPKEMMPQALFTGNFMIADYSDNQSELLAKTTPLAVGNGIIDANKPMAAASYVHLGRMIKFARPWVEYALVKTLEDLDESLVPEDSEDEFPYEVTGKDVLSVWDALSKFGEVTGTVTVTSEGTVSRSVYTSQK